jgi:hypothetical protein
MLHQRAEPRATNVKFKLRTPTCRQCDTPCGPVFEASTTRGSDEQIGLGAAELQPQDHGGPPWFHAETWATCKQHTDRLVTCGSRTVTILNGL